MNKKGSIEINLTDEKNHARETYHTPPQYFLSKH